MKKTIEKNEKRIDELQDQIKKLISCHAILSNHIGDLQEELQGLQSENSVMREEMKSGKDIE